MNKCSNILAIKNLKAIINDVFDAKSVNAHLNIKKFKILVEFVSIFTGGPKECCKNGNLFQV